MVVNLFVILALLLKKLCRNWGKGKWILKNGTDRRVKKLYSGTSKQLDSKVSSLWKNALSSNEDNSP